MSIRILYKEDCTESIIGSDGNGNYDYETVCVTTTQQVIDWNIFKQNESVNFTHGGALPSTVIQEVTIAELDKIYQGYDIDVKIKFTKSDPLIDWVSVKLAGTSLLVDGTENDVLTNFGATDNLVYTFNTVGLPVGSYYMSFELLSYETTAGITSPLTAENALPITKGSISLLITETPVDPNDYGNLKYFFEYKNIEDYFRCEVYERGFQGISKEVNGNVILKYQDKTDVFDPISASNISVEFESNLELTFEDLYTEKENVFLTKFYRNGKVIFIGYLKPDGIWEDLVSDKWIMSIDGTDGLSTLKKLSFVKPNGTFFHGKISQMEILYNLLLRTGINLPINISIDISFAGIDTTLNSILEAVLMNADRFYQDAAKNNIMDCEEVLMSILQIYNANIFQQSGEWFIVRQIDITNEMTFKRYVNGVYSNDNIISVNTQIGSHTNNAKIFHANANQKKSIMPSVQSFRVGYKYGLVKSILKNSNLSFGSGLNIDYWNIVASSGNITKLSQGGFKVESTVDEIIIESDQAIPVLEADKLQLYLSYKNEYFNSGIGFVLRTPNFYFKEGEWIAGNLDFINKITNTDQVDGYMTKGFTVDFTPPEDGNLIIKVSNFTSFANSILSIYEIELRPSKGILKGEFHTAQRNTRISSVTKEDITVSIGDSISDVYYGTLYKSNGFPTNKTWRRKGITENRELLDIMAEDNLRVSPRPMKFLEGDIYGYVPYLSLVKYDLVSGKYIPLSYTYNTLSNIISFNCKEFSSEMITDFNIEKDFEYNNEIKPTIK